MPKDDDEVRGFGILRECWKDIRERRGPIPEEREEASPPAGPTGGVSLTEEHRRRMEESFRQ